MRIKKRILKAEIDFQKSELNRLINRNNKALEESKESLITMKDILVSFRVQIITLQSSLPETPEFEEINNLYKLALDLLNEDESNFSINMLYEVKNILKEVKDGFEELQKSI